MTNDDTAGSLGTAGTGESVAPPTTPSDRAETGVMQFGDDWPGVFIRGDNALSYGLSLWQFLDQTAGADVSPLVRLQVQGLLRLLSATDAREEPKRQAMKPFDEASGSQATTD